ADKNNNKIKNVSRETVPSIHTNKHSHKRSTMPSLGDVTRPMDFFFGDSASTTFMSSKAKNNEETVIGEKNNAAEKSNKTAKNEPLKPVKGGYLAYLKPLDIVPNAHQPRTIFDEDELRELASSIKEVGVLQPIVVRPIVDADKNDEQIAHYELIMGERRWRASQLAELDTVPAIVRTTADENMLRDALLENLHRVALNPLEEAAAYSQMIDDFGLTQIQLSQSVSKSRPQIANTLRLLNLPASVQKHVASGVLSAGHARALLGLENPEDMESLANRIIAEGLSVRSTEEIVSLKNEDTSHGAVRTRVRRNNQWSSSPVRKQLEEHFATKVSIKGTENHGRIEIVFSSPEEMQRIIGLLVSKKE
ncbi:chromosome partitioning protein ParB, partial [Bifidobacteriaceae bacterium NR016]